MSTYDIRLVSIKSDCKYIHHIDAINSIDSKKFDLIKIIRLEKTTLEYHLLVIHYWLSKIIILGHIEYFENKNTEVKISM